LFSLPSLAAAQSGQRRRVYEWLDHTSELELRVRADSATAVIAEATAALAEVLGEPAGGPEAIRTLAVTARDPAGLLAGWLVAVVLLAEHDGLVPVRAQALELADGALRGEVVARPGRASPLVKAITYHRLALERDERGWWGRAVLDV
jgi:SHS2 domain-containing protein